MSDERTTELARRICAAFISYQLGVRPEYYYKRYVMEEADGVVGELWHEMARQCATLFDAAQEQINERVMKHQEHSIQ